MDVLKLRNNDLVPIIGLGTFRSKPNETYDAVKMAIEIGYRHIDCAAIYGNEKEVGLAIADAIKNGTVKREDLWITSKLWCNAHGKENVLPALQKTLSDLQLEYLDLYLIHWPIAIKPDATFPLKASSFFTSEEQPLENTWEGMIEAQKAGFTRHIGVSNFSIRNLKKLMTYKDNAPEVNQVEIHPYLQQNELIAFCKEHNILMTAYAPLGSGLATKELLENPTINTIAQRHQMTPAQVLLRWEMQREVMVIPKSTHAERLKQNFEAAQFNLTEEDMEQIAPLNQNKRLIHGRLWEVKDGPLNKKDLWD